MFNSQIYFKSKSLKNKEWERVIKKLNEVKFLLAPMELQERKEVKAHSQIEIRPNPQKNSEFK